MLAAIALAINAARNPAELDAWCSEHVGALAALPAGEYPVAYSLRLRRLAELEIPAQPNLPALVVWWGANREPMRHLVPADRERVVALKDDAKARLAARPDGIAPPPAIRPARGRHAGPDGARLL